ncbi:SLAM family member 9 isoform X3 [Brienomyrus brachyistius]|uniref:SLAM family member 9 isoform X3 n=1 Tax=Brienomyrus brachyistius TaxID=42636 RepID=UPI0020B2DA08|nr:SLAM family member 9 isoform X3 [Brienomyrus brachyistius]
MYRKITVSCIILFMLFSGYENENLEQTGLLGKSVTLLSRANKAWNLSTIEWSIFNNDSYIAVFYGDQPEYFRQQSKRLKLNIRTGDLEIMDLHREDSGTYTVHVRTTEDHRWNNEVFLSVQEGLPEPKITVINSTEQHGLCNIFLTCSVSSDRKVTITWSSEALPHGCIIRQLPYVIMGREAEAWCSATQDVNITCTASDIVSTAASTVTTGCSRKEDISAKSCPTKGFTILILILILMIIILCFILMYIKRDDLSKFARTSLERLRERRYRECKNANKNNNMPDPGSTDPKSQSVQMSGGQCSTDPITTD